MNSSLALLTDLYQLTMSYGYWKAGLHSKEAVSHLFFRRKPFDGGFTIAAGLESVLEGLQDFRFSSDDTTYLASLVGSDGSPLFEEPFLRYLEEMQLSCDIDAVPEGTVVFPYEPLIRVQGPIIQSQILESCLLNLINFPTLIATKAARVCLAAKGDPVIEFGLRRAQGVDGALTASRAAYLGGCVATSNVMAGKHFGIPVRGTQAHSWVMLFEDELEAFLTYCRVMPHNAVLLVDTYHTLEGVKKAIIAGQQLKREGHRLVGIRLDSGDLAYLSIQARQMLDDAGLADTEIVASNELNETIISDLKQQGARIGVWGVGTSLVTGGPQAALDGVYKLSAVRDPGGPWRYCLKISEQMKKISNPGILQVRRYHSGGLFVGDVIHDCHTDLSQGASSIDPFDTTRKKQFSADVEWEDLLVPVIRGGKVVYTPPPLSQVRCLVQEQLAALHPAIKRFIYPHEYPVGMEASLHQLKLDLVNKIRHG